MREDPSLFEERAEPIDLFFTTLRTLVERDDLFFAALKGGVIKGALFPVAEIVSGFPHLIAISDHTEEIVDHLESLANRDRPALKRRELFGELALRDAAGERT